MYRVIQSSGRKPLRKASYAEKYNDIVQQAMAMSCVGHEQIQTPNMDKLAAQGQETELAALKHQHRGRNRQKNK